MHRAVLRKRSSSWIIGFNYWKLNSREQYYKKTEKAQFSKNDFTTANFLQYKLKKITQMMEVY